MAEEFVEEEEEGGGDVAMETGGTAEGGESGDGDCEAIS